MALTDTDLLHRYAPVLQYDSHELYYADSASTFTDNVFDGGPMAGYANALRRTDGTVVARAGHGLTLDFLRPDRYADGQEVRDGDFLDGAGSQYVADARRLHADAGLANRIYGVVRPGAAGHRWLQYWFFYYYNDKSLVGFGVHEGDWEGVQIRVDGRGHPDEVTFAQHDGGERATWSEVEIDEATNAPIVYVALGSHASYLRRGAHEAPIVDDICDAGGRRVRPDLEVVTDDMPSWVRWPGRWGASPPKGLISFPSPPAPRTQGRWGNPDHFHAAARRYQASRGKREPVTQLPPTVTASRVADVLSVRLECAPRAAKLVVTATVEGRPTALEYDLSQVDEGAPQPLPPTVGRPTGLLPKHE